MTKLLKAEVYKIFHSIYFWLIWAIYLAINTILVPDFVNRGMTWIRSSLFYGTYLFFMVVALAVAAFGNDMEHRVLDNYVAAGHSRFSVFLSKTLVYLTCGTIMLTLTLLIHTLIGHLTNGDQFDYRTVIMLIPSFVATCTIPMFFAFIFQDIGKTLVLGLVSFVVMVTALNYDSVSEKIIYLPFAQRLVFFSGKADGHLALMLVIDVIWIAVFTAGSYLAFCRRDLK